jgi:hypothetical protein
MKNFKKLMMLATLTITAQQAIIAEDDMDIQDAQPRHQGFGRIFTAAENTLTLHPGNAVNSLATGDQADTSFGYQRNDEGKVKAKRANTKRNKQERAKDQARNKKDEARRKKEAAKKKNSKEKSSWFSSKKSKNNSERSMTKKQPKKVVAPQDSFEDNSAE